MNMVLIGIVTLVAHGRCPLSPRNCAGWLTGAIGLSCASPFISAQG
jgi:hypothetical protein